MEKEATLQNFHFIILLASADVSNTSAHNLEASKHSICAFMLSFCPFLAQRIVLALWISNTQASWDGPCRGDPSPLPTEWWIVPKCNGPTSGAKRTKPSKFSNPATIMRKANSQVLSRVRPKHGDAPDFLVCWDSHWDLQPFSLAFPSVMSYRLQGWPLTVLTYLN